MIFMLIAPGFEETEALCTLDILRRAELEVYTIGVGGKTITGSHGITIECDKREDEISDLKGLAGVLLPGGMPGTLNLQKSEFVNDLLDYAYEEKLIIGAICAAASVLGQKGFLEGRRATCYPGFESQLYKAEVVSEPVVTDENIVTAWGAGASFHFGLKLTELFCGKERAEKIKESMLCII